MLLEKPSMIKALTDYDYSELECLLGALDLNREDASDPDFDIEDYLDAIPDRLFEVETHGDSSYSVYEYKME